MLVRDLELPETANVPQVDGMLAANEKRYLYGLTRDAFEDVGAIVEVGSWLGLSAVHLAAGLRDADRRAQIHCFDDFGLLDGSSRLRSFSENVKSFGDRVQPRQSLIRDLRWDGSPIELLFLDAPKNWRDFADVIEAFGPSLVPGRSCISLQDYLFFPAYPLAVQMHRLGAAVTLQHVVPEASTVTFRVDSPISVDKARTLAQPPSWTRNEIEQTWMEILQALPEASGRRLSHGQLLHLETAGHANAACELADSIELDSFLATKWASHFPMLCTVAPMVSAVMARRLRSEFGQNPEQSMRAEVPRRTPARLPGASTALRKVVSTVNGAKTGLREVCMDAMRRAGFRTTPFYFGLAETCRELGRSRSRELFALERSYHDRILRESDPARRCELYVEINKAIKEFKQRHLPDRKAYGFTTRYIDAHADLFQVDAVLDFGCGYGLSTERLARLARNVVGVDIAEICVEEATAKRAGDRVRFQLVRDMELPFENDSFDAAYSNDVLEHIHLDDARRHLSETRRVLKEGGKYLLFTPSSQTGPHDMTKAFWPQGRGYPPLGSHIHEYSFDELRRLAQDVGFRSVVRGDLPEEVLLVATK